MDIVLLADLRQKLYLGCPEADGVALVDFNRLRLGLIGGSGRAVDMDLEFLDDHLFQLFLADLAYSEGGYYRF